ncbi:MAG: nuclear transport factor 2 family protein [Vicinamibacterales bacterium]
MHRLLLSMLLVSALAGCHTQDASTSTAAAGLDDTAGAARTGARILGTDVDPETRKDIIQLDLEQNDANAIGDSEGMIDRMLADDTLWVGATGRIVTKPQILAVTRFNFLKNPTRTKKDAAPHDDFGLRRFGDVIVQHGRSTTMNPDGSRGQARRYLIVLQKQRGQWWVIGRETIPIDYTPQPDSAEVLAAQAQAKPSPTSRIFLGTDVEPEVQKEVLRLSAAQNDAAATGDSDNVTRDRLFADDIVWVSSTGHVQTKDEFLAGVRANFQKNPNRRATGTINKHDDFTVRRFGDTIIHLGRSTTINADKSEGPRRRYMNVFMNRGGEWWFVAHGATPIVEATRSGT